MLCNVQFSLRIIRLAAVFAVVLLAASASATDIFQAEADELAAPQASLRGRIVYDGPPPEQPRLQLPLTRGVRDPGGKTRQVDDPSARRASELGLKDESLIVGPHGGVANVFVWLNSRWLPPVEPRPLPPVKMLIAQGRFEPHALAFWNNRKLEVTNLTDEAATINWQPPGGAVVNPLLKPGQRILHAVGDLAAIPSPVTSTLQPWMKAYVLALPHPYFAITDDEGRFEIRNLPPGQWEFAMWHEGPGWLANERYAKGRFTLEVSRQATDLGELKFLPAAFERHPAAQANAPQPKPDLSPLQIAARDGDAVQVRKLLDGGMWIEARGRDGALPLQMAASCGHADVVHLLLARGAKVDDRDRNQRTALIWAAQKGHEDVVRVLLEAGAEVNAVDTSGWTALDYANIGQPTEKARRLLVERGAKTRAQLAIGNSQDNVPQIDRLDDRGFSQLHNAAMAGKLDRMRALLDEGANVNVEQAIYHGTPLQYAAHFAGGDAVQLLVEHRATIDARDTQDRTPLMWAAMKGKVDGMRRLLDAGADVNATSQIGWTALHFAAQGGHADACQLLVEHGADETAKNKVGQTPAQVATGGKLP